MILNSKISVCVFTYNYELYIDKCIQSIIDQITQFPIEILISDDFSTDQTRALCLKWNEKYPDIIKLNFNEKNIGGTANWIKAINLCDGNYIALIDGDDYFTDVNKLQKQFDALESNKEAVLCFHSVEEKYEDVLGLDKVVRFEKKIYTIDDFLKNGWFIRTSSTFFRNGIIPLVPPKWVFDFPYRYDTILHVLLTMHGYAINLQDTMSVWRKHSSGMSYTLMKNKIQNALHEIELANKLNSFTQFKYNTIVKQYISDLKSFLLINLIKSGKFLQHPVITIRTLQGANFNILKQQLTKKISGNKKT